MDGKVATAAPRLFTFGRRAAPSSGMLTDDHAETNSERLRTGTDGVNHPR